MALMSVDVDRWLQDTLRSTNVAGWAPSCNAYEDEHGFHIEVALPGVDRHDVKRWGAHGEGGAERSQL